MGLMNGMDVATSSGSFWSCVRRSSAEKNAYVAIRLPKTEAVMNLPLSLTKWNAEFIAAAAKLELVLLDK